MHALAKCVAVMLAFAKYVAVTTSVLAAAVLLYATVLEWDERGARTTLACQRTRCI